LTDPYPRMLLSREGPFCRVEGLGRILGLLHELRQHEWKLVTLADGQNSREPIAGDAFESTLGLSNA
jgi:hypothetical protein